MENQQPFCSSNPKINLETPSHIITIEDPIEYLFKDSKSTVNQREVGIDTQSFFRCLFGHH